MYHFCNGNGNVNVAVANAVNAAADLIIRNVVAQVIVEEGDLVVIASDIRVWYHLKNDPFHLSIDETKTKAYICRIWARARK